MQQVLLILAALAVLAGLLFLSEATTGVGILAFAGVMSIWARIAQSSKQHEELKAMLKQNENMAE